MSTVPLTSEALVDSMCSPRGKRARVVPSWGFMAHALVLPSLFIQTRLQVQDIFIAPGQSGARFVGLVGCPVAVRSLSCGVLFRRAALAGEKEPQESF